MKFTAADILWVKNVTDKDGRGVAYIPFTNRLHFPDHVGRNISSPQVNEIILLRQTVNVTETGNRDRRAFTHLVTPIDDKIRKEPVPGYSRARNVRLIAMTPLDDLIYVEQTTFPHLWTRGNACRIERLRGTHGLKQLQEAIWKAFEPYFGRA